MPTYSKAVSTTEALVAESDTTRTCLIFSNPDSTENIYVSDQPGVGTGGIVVGPSMTIVLTAKDGWNVKAAHYAYCAQAKYLNIGVGNQVIDVNQPPPGDGLPHPKDPPM